MEYMMAKDFIFEDRKIGINYPPLVIAEIGINHNGSLEEAFKLVDAASKAGVEVIKHQTHIVEDEMSLEAKEVIPGNTSKNIYQVMKECSLNEEEEFKLMNYVKSKGIKFFSSPFSRAAVDRLIKFNVPVFKIGSGECNNYPLLEHIAKFNKPVILSTGMHNLDVVQKAVSIFEKKSIPIAILHTTNLYPTPEHLVRLGALSDINRIFPNAPFGLSDHTLSNLACIGAVALGASILERHFTDTMDRNGPDISCSMDIKECRELIDFSKRMYLMQGGSKTQIVEEQVTRDFAFASIVAIQDIEPGTLLNEKNIWVKRPGKNGIPADKYYEMIGKITSKKIKKNTQIKYEDLET
jgi:sialic acid synthase SpsE